MNDPNDPKDPDDPVRLPNEPENKTLTARPQEPSTSSPRTYMIVITDKTSSRVELPSHGVLVIGRDPESDVPIEDPIVSRRHARLLMSDHRVRVEDLNSHNGTRVNGHQITEAMPIFAGDELTIGPAALLLHTEAKAVGSQVLDAEGLRLRLVTEIERASAHDRSLAVVALHIEDPRTVRDVAQAAVGAMLRGGDGLGWTDDGYLVAILPELQADEAHATALRLERAARARVGPRRCGLACFPRDAGDAMDLLGAARTAAVKPGEVGEARLQVIQLTLGERPPLWLADPTMIRLYDRLLRRLAASELPVLIQGETGTGKESVAYAVHVWSSRQKARFLPLNCAALQESLAESELFGHEKGAFTGATEAKPGHFERARGGTLFLDEVGELSLGVQAKLLRALEGKRILRLGGKDEREVDVRLVAATNRNLTEEVKQGRFREDLYFRLKGARVIVPPLRDRPRELGLLAENFLAEARLRCGRESLALSAAALQQLRNYRWPGNVRELKNAMEYAATTIDEWVTAVEPWHLPEEVCDPRLLAEVTALGAAPSAEPEPPASVPASSPIAPRPPIFQPLGDEVRDLERRRMREALEATGWVQTRAAVLLKMALRTFVMKLKLYGLKRPGPETLDG